VAARRSTARFARTGRFDRGAAFLLSRVGDDLQQHFRVALAPLGLDPREFALMVRIAGDQGASQQATGDALGIAKSAMVAIVDGLERRELVERRLRRDDRRARGLHLTPAGDELLTRAQAIAAAHEDTLRAALSPEEHRRLVSLLQQVAARYDPSPRPQAS
jgi:DNA-binding MarR family transcriptional regulator